MSIASKEPNILSWCRDCVFAKMTHVTCIPCLCKENAEYKMYQRIVVLKCNLFTLTGTHLCVVHETMSKLLLHNVVVYDTCHSDNNYD
jgi:hypothetical protein